MSSHSTLTRSQSAVSASVSQITWEEALRKFLMHKEATFLQRTVRYYSFQLRQLAVWAEAEDTPIG